MDSYRHVNNTMYLRYLETARLEFLAFPGSPSDRGSEVAGADAEPSDGLVIAVAEVAYHRQLTFRPEPVVVQSWVSRIGRSSFSVDHRLVDPEHLPPGRPYAEAATTLVAVNRETSRSRPLRRHEFAWLEQWSLSAEEAAAMGTGRRRRAAI